MSNYKHLQSKLAKRHKGLFHRVENTACLKHLNRWLISPVIIKCKVKKKKRKTTLKRLHIIRFQVCEILEKYEDNSKISSWQNFDGAELMRHGIF